MNFVSLAYFLFLPCVMLLAYLLPLRFRNAALLLASWGFYLCFGPKFGLFLLLSTLSTYGCGLLLERSRRRCWLALTLLLNFGMLLLLKYANFFLSLGAGLLGAQAPRLNLLLPVGISFYTFQAAGYLLDVWRWDKAPERDFIDYALFVSFFPQVASGPIGRSTQLLPQLKTPRPFSDENLKRGALRLLWGMAKKLLVADHLAVVVNTAFADVRACSEGQLAFAVFCLAFQIYFDFSAYTDIALGSARLLGVELMENFRCPYAARSLKEFWRRWHISLSTWFRDYLYFPLGGSRKGKARTCINLLIVFAVSGLWHGAALTFVVWGLLHGIFQALGILLRPLRERLYRLVPRDSLPMRVLSWLGTFLLVAAAWVFFKADSLADAVYALRGALLWLPHFALPALTALGLRRLTLAAAGLFLALGCAVDLVRERRDIGAWLCARDVPRYLVYFCLLAAMLLFGHYGSGFDPQDFVYFQF